MMDQVLFNKSIKILESDHNLGEQEDFDDNVPLKIEKKQYTFPCK